MAVPSNDHPSVPASTPGALARRGLEPLSRQNYKVAHQKISIDVDLENNVITGTTELIVIPTEPVLRQVKLDSRQLEVSEVFVNNRRANFAYEDRLHSEYSAFKDHTDEPIVNDITQHHFYKNKFKEMFSGENTEELVIFMPERMKLTLHDPSTIHSLTPSYRESPGSHRTSTATEAVYTPVNIKIEYKLKNPKSGLVFVGGKGTQLPRSEWHAFTSNPDIGVSTSSWVPCVDSLWEKSTWELEISIPRTVKDIGVSRIIGSNFQEKDINMDEEEEGENNNDLVVVGGDFNNQKETAHTIDMAKKLVSFSIFNPTSAQHIGFSVGPYVQLPLLNLQEEEEPDLQEEKDTTAVPCSIYCLPHQQNDAINTTIFLYKAIDFYSREFGSFPFTSYALVFVSDISVELCGFAGLSILSKNLLYAPNVIEPIYTSTYKLSVALSEQWSGINVVPKTFNDFWVTLGIAHYMAQQFTKKLMGTNEYKYRVKKQADRICEEDIGRRPLAEPFLTYPISTLDFEFLELKSPIVLFILDRRMTKTDKSFGLSRVIPKIFLQAMSGDLANGCLSTYHFQHVCEKVNHNRLESFFRQWVYGSGVPIFRVTQRFNKKRMFIEMGIRQVQHQETENQHPSPDTFISEARRQQETTDAQVPATLFTGPMTIRIHEADGTPYEHIVDLKEGFTKLDIQYNTKYKRLKRSQKQQKSDKDKPEPDEDETVLLHCLGDILQSDQEIKEWDLTEWTKEEEEKMNNEAFEWIRVDADFEWICKIHINQPDYMYASQLQQDRDVEAQLESINYFSIANPSTLYSSILLRTLLDSRYYYGVRLEAAKGMAKYAKEKSNWIGLKHLLTAFKRLYCFENSSIPFPNEFSDFPSYFLKKAIPEALSTIQDKNNNCPLEVRRFLLDILKFNDNLNNPYSDAFYVSHLITCLVRSLTSNVLIDNNSKLNSTDREFLNNAVAELSRHQKMDEWIPSYNSLIGVSAFNEKLKLARKGLLELDPDYLFEHTKENYFPDVRITAFQGLFQSGGLKNSRILHYFFLLTSFEKSPYMRHKLIEAFAQSFGVVVIEGGSTDVDEDELTHDIEIEKKTKETDTGLVVIDEGAKDQFETRKDAFAKATLKGAIELLRRDYSEFKPLRDELWNALRNPLFSIPERRALFDVVAVLIPVYDVLVAKFKLPRAKKVAAQNLGGGGKVLLKREGHFKISLSKKLTINTKTPAPSIPRRKSITPKAPVIKLTHKSSQSPAPVEPKSQPYKAEIRKSKSGPLRYVKINSNKKAIVVSSDPLRRSKKSSSANVVKEKKPEVPAKPAAKIPKFNIMKPKAPEAPKPKAQDPIKEEPEVSSKPKLKLKFKFGND
ncbi:Transcription initiation factor TFIID subunit 2 [Wickerhamomyces ciferrii]|uniref:Transcription initiation factor TFIID subunit 2 n=1 Tax=Wickerhamomyces ciferrii (strain ATCC 14091 / BCRC 22168 / CBS 111 / JCM 3599 / NBRC 0793 / NRRL Y-1031 F-60-10) TaxID=1206466 RepID=K0KNQ3_WICCF|nr:Transcription initiation factor TFIID subunit 2 [Wickerhamomyces ciferrii]CCH43782.1 Transcription initiation factor TFIID subunit 2 [Wickerhamomyces ciferrii]